MLFINLFCCKLSVFPLGTLSSLLFQVPGNIQYTHSFNNSSISSSSIGSTVFLVVLLRSIHLLASPSHNLHLPPQRDIPGITLNRFRTHSPALASRWPDSVQWCAQLCVFSQAKHLLPDGWSRSQRELSLCYWIWHLHTSGQFPPR